MRKSLFASVAAAGALASALVAPAVSNAVPTTVTFTIGGGDISISAETDKELDVSGLTASGSIAVEVSDQRRVIGVWVATASSTSFDKTDLPAESISPLLATYTPTDTTVSTGPLSATVVSTPLSSLAVPLPVQSAVVTGANEVSWDGGVTITLPPQVQAGDYIGTVTHSLV
ncbi:MULTISPECIES: hypothetical protein [unclassified Rhodococcus (in: high G+C Gram-positive bacteria)]|uniref:hypothetical protein n=1 Tax=unclassified Rhodococcus (in: high G+C Gram-positive bacteria) TaxID=192944 RepID=UPI0011EEF4C1|nr:MULTISPECIES: hypothetical protein [unclassified Rhodococcus (in: high G+C Gram-positive bacteria)]KAA0927811.1 hypothetical protein FQ188_01600 [Rhodococcus sp. ANT_H53B]MDI9925725.1 hypothetical protein [Rhodococcus sp. IEGM 1341]